MLSELNSISLIRQFCPIQWSNCEVINFQRKKRLFFGSEEVYFSTSFGCQNMRYVIDAQSICYKPFERF